MNFTYCNIVLGIVLFAIVLLSLTKCFFRESRDNYKIDYSRQNAKLTNCSLSPECNYGVDDGKPCKVTHLDLLDGTVVPFVTECSAEGQCYRGWCCNFNQDPLLV